MEIGEYIVKRALKLGADDIVATVVNGTTRQIRFANNDITLNTTWDIVNVEVFLSCKKRLIASSLDNPSQSETFSSVSKTKNIRKEDVDKFLSKMIKMAKMMMPKGDYHGIADSKFKYGKLKDCYDKKVADLSDRNVDFVDGAINAAVSEGAKRCAGVLYSDAWDERKFTSNGIDAADKGTRASISLRAFVEKDESGHSVSVSRIMKGFEPEKAGQEAGMLAKQYKKPEQGEAGKHDVIFGPMIMSNMLYYMSYAFSAFEVDSRMSFLKGRIGQKIASDNFSLLDDGRLPNGASSTLFDEEGRPTQTNKIIDHGVLRTFLHNTSTAKKFKAKPTGNAGIIYPTYWNLALEGGDSNLEEMISEVKNGVYITNTWYTRFRDYFAGDFSTIPRDAMFEIKDGRITRPVKGMRLSDNMKRVLENVQLISKERRQIKWWEVTKPVLTGWVLCRDLNLTKSTK